MLFHRSFRVIVALTIFAGSQSANAQRLVPSQLVHGGSMAVWVRAPNGWVYTPATQREQQKDRVLAIYGLDGIPLQQMSVYLTIIPIELRKPEFIDVEIEYDKKMSLQNGLVIDKTEKFKNSNGDLVAINTWNGSNFRRYVGLYPTKEGVLMVIGSSSSAKHHSHVHDGVLDILKTARTMKAIEPPPVNRTTRK